MTMFFFSYAFLLNELIASVLSTKRIRSNYGLRALPGNAAIGEQKPVLLFSVHPAMAIFSLSGVLRGFLPATYRKYVSA